MCNKVHRVGDNLTTTITKILRKVNIIIWHTHFDSRSKLSHVRIPRSPLQVKETDILHTHLYFLFLCCKINLNALVMQKQIKRGQKIL